MKLHEKLHDIQTKVKGLGKDKKSHQYSYVTGDKVLSFIRPLMDEHKLLLKQEVLSIDNERMDYKTKYGEKSEILSKVMMRFTWIDTETGEKDENLFGANGQNDWEKGLGSALTYAERYFLLKFFHIATDEDDIDNPARKPEPTKKEEKETPKFDPSKTPPPVKPITAAQKENLKTLKEQAKLSDKRFIQGVEKASGKLTDMSANLTEPQAASLIKMITKIIETEKNTSKA